MLYIDPLDMVIKNQSSFTSKVISYLIQSLAASAITTTVIGSILTLKQFFNDLIFSILLNKDINKNKDISNINNTVNNNNKRQAWLSSLLSIVPATIISATGSADLYYLATAFSGAFPVIIIIIIMSPLFSLFL